MLLAYCDESGDVGMVNSPTKYFVLATVLVRESDWLSTLNRMIDLRRQLKASYGLTTRREIKAKNFRDGKGPFDGLNISPANRWNVYREVLRYQEQIGTVRTFAVAIEKHPASSKGWSPFHAAWQFTLQRINRFCIDEDERAMIFPDEGNIGQIKKLLRKVRRHQIIPSYFPGKATVPFPTDRIVEDPNQRASHDSYFIQLADWNAYAAKRSQAINPYGNTPVDLWDDLGTARVTEVNRLRGGPVGIVKYP